MSLFFLHLWKIILQDTAFWLFFFNFKYPLHSLACMIPKEKWDIILIFVLLGKDSSLLPPQFLSRVLLLIFWSFEYHGYASVQFSSVAQSCLTLWPHESQHARPPCPSPTPRVLSNSRPLSRWCHPAISSSVIPFTSPPKSLPASESFPMSQLFAWSGQSTRVSALASFLPKKSQG